MKKTKRIVLSLIILIIVIGISTASIFLYIDSKKRTLTEGMNLSENVEKFYSYIQRGRFVKAEEFLENEIYMTEGGVAELEKSSIMISNKINEELLKGIITLEQAKLYRNYLDCTKLYVYDFYEPTSEYEDICFSKASYTEGYEKYMAGLYIEAIEKLELVRVDDCNYDSAQTYINQAKEKYKDEILEEFNTKIDKNELIEGIKFLKESMGILKDDAEIISLIEQYEKKFTDSVIKKAEDIFVDVSKDWEAASDIIKQAQQHFPDNKVLQKQREYYEQYSPTSLFDMHLFDQSYNYELSAVTDSMGNTYEKAMAYRDYGRIRDWQTGDDISNSMDAVYILDKKYNVLKFTVSVGEKEISYDSHSGCDMTIRVYGDGKKIYDAGNLKASTKPYETEVNVTGISELKVRIMCNAKGDYINKGRKAIFANPILYRTVK